MFGKLLLAIVGIVCGVLIGYLILIKPQVQVENKNVSGPQPSSTVTRRQVVGFLPFWLTDSASSDYSRYITTLAYFSLTIDKDGTIQRYVNQVEGEPGWFALKNGKMDTFLSGAKDKGIKLSLVVFDSSEESITAVLSDPVKHAQNLIGEVVPVMKEYGFSDLNVDMESVNDASPSARANFAKFISEVKKGLDKEGAGTLTVDISPIAFVKDTNLVDPKAITPYVDYIILMAYDFHNPGSFVTGPVAPLAGAGTVSEFDTEIAVEKALSIMPAQKVILGIPLYGYEWETINNVARSATLPGSSVIISNKRVEEFLTTCTNCDNGFDNIDQEAYTIYKDTQTGTYHQIFYPTSSSTQMKVDYAKANKLGGMALWALGYEGSSILQPLAGYRY